MRIPATAVSLALHILAAILLFTITFPQYVPQMPLAVVHILAPSPLKPVRPLPKDGGGGQRQPMPATKGRAAEIVAKKVWVAPMISIETPKLVVISALAEPPDSNIAAPQMGDPRGALGVPSGGIGGPVGIGNHGNGGIGDGDGSRQGGARVPLRKLTREPQLIYKEDPEFTDEARKARHEGTVIIDLDIDAAGRPVNIRVIRGLGMGLDERALAAVAHWKFRPALAGDRPVTAPARVSVSFHLL